MACRVRSAGERHCHGAAAPAGADPFPVSRRWHLRPSDLRLQDARTSMPSMNAGWQSANGPNRSALQRTEGW